MIKIVKFENVPMKPGDNQMLMLDGNEPFTLTYSCFVDNPPGFRPCEACSDSVTIGSNQVHEIRCDPFFWQGKTGRIIVHITDGVGNSKSLSINVLSDNMSYPEHIAMSS